MSTDTVDDLHEAEDLAMALAHHAKKVIDFAAAYPWTGLDDAPDEVRDALAQLGAFVERAETYCRPSCGAEGEPDSDECENNDWCGCRCGHTERGQP